MKICLWYLLCIPFSTGPRGAALAPLIGLRHPLLVKRCPLDCTFVLEYRGRIPLSHQGLNSNLVKRWFRKCKSGCGIEMLDVRVNSLLDILPKKLF